MNRHSVLINDRARILLDLLLQGLAFGDHLEYAAERTIDLPLTRYDLVLVFLYAPQGLLHLAVVLFDHLECVEDGQRVVRKLFACPFKLLREWGKVLLDHWLQRSLVLESLSYLLLCGLTCLQILQAFVTLQIH